MPLFPNSRDKDARKRDADRMFRDSIEHVGEDELSTAAVQGEEKFRRLDADIPSSLQAVWNELKLLLAMLRDYASGVYRQVPFGAIAAIAAAVLYFVSPIDAIPDFIPGLGYIDDAAVLMTCLRMVRTDVEAYREWREAKVA